MSTKRRSCKDRLNELRKEFGISKKDYKRAGKEAVSGALPSRDKMDTFILANSEEDAARIARERGLDDYKTVIRDPEPVDPVISDLMTKKGKKMAKEEARRKNKRRSADWYVNDVWQDSDGVYHNVQDGDVVFYKDEMNALSRQEMYNIAKRWLFDMIYPWERHDILRKFNDTEDTMEVVRYAVVQYYLWKEAFVLPNQDRMDFDQWAKQELVRRESEDLMEREWPVNADPNAPGYPMVYIEGDEIPYFYEDRYDAYCKKHPIKRPSEEKERRRKFIDKMNKEYRKTVGEPVLHARDITEELVSSGDYMYTEWAKGEEAAIQERINWFNEQAPARLAEMRDTLEAMSNIFVSNSDGEMISLLEARQREAVMDAEYETEESIKDELRSKYTHKPGVSKKEFDRMIEKSAKRAMKNQRKYYRRLLQATDKTAEEEAHTKAALMNMKQTQFLRKYDGLPDTWSPEFHRRLKKRSKHKKDTSAGFTMPMLD